MSMVNEKDQWPKCPCRKCKAKRVDQRVDPRGLTVSAMELTNAIDELLQQHEDCLLDREHPGYGTVKGCYLVADISSLLASVRC